MLIKFFHISFILLILLVGGYKVHNQTSLNWTVEEKQWLEEHPELTLAVDDTYPPLNFTDNKGDLKGLNIELVRLVEQRLGIHIKLEGSNWSEALEKALTHKVDGIINANMLPDRLSKLNFSNELFRDPLALVTYKDNNIKDFSNIKFQRIAAKKGSRHMTILREKVPEHLIIEINTLEEGIDLLSIKRIDGIYDDLAPLYHVISSEGYSHLKVAFIESQGGGARIGLRNDDPMLLAIMNKAIDSITADERLAIQDKWLRFSPQEDYTPHYITIGILLTVVLFIGLWSWSLNTMVKKRTIELKEELKLRKETEVQLIRAKEQAEESDRLKSAFLANISHEIRTPMNGIFGFVELLQLDIYNKEEQSKYLSLILSSAKQLLSIINDLVNISKLEANLVEIHKSKVDLNVMMQELHSVFAIENQSVDIELAYSVNCSGQVEIDEVKVKQVMSNLIGNALKNTEKGYVRFVALENECEQSIQFYVEDSGVGIKPKDQENIFNRFWKVNHGANQSGTGLGLAISKAHIELMGGRIWVESKVDEGSTFNFIIPTR